MLVNNWFTIRLIYFYLIGTDIHAQVIRKIYARSARPSRGAAPDFGAGTEGPHSDAGDQRKLHQYLLSRR